VSGSRSWLAKRRPVPPAELASAFALADEGDSPERVLTEAGLRRLAEARGQPGRVRESAFRLLEADALLTYACEAALEGDDPEAGLRWILSLIGS